MTRAPVVSLELLFDEEGEQRLREEWRALAAAGHSSMAAHSSPSNRPHVTLLVRSEQGHQGGDAIAIARVVEAVAPLLPLAVRLDDPMLFGAADDERRVLVRPLVAAPALLSLHAAVHAAAGPGADAPHTAPGEWTPHVTLARRLKSASVGAALPLLGSPFAGRLVALRRWDARTATVTPLLP